MTVPRPPRSRQDTFARPIARLVCAIEANDARDALSAANSIAFLARLWAPKRKPKAPRPTPAPVKPLHDPNEGGREVARYFGLL